MYLQTGGGGKGIRPVQQQPQQFNQNQHSISQLQLHPNQSAHHQSNQSTHNIHTVQQQLPSASLHLGHQQQQQNLSHFPHTHQNQQHPPQQSQLSHAAPSYLVQLNQPPPTLPQSNNATPGPQMGSSPPMQGSNTSISSSSSGTQLQCFGSNNSINHNNNPTNIGRQQTVSNNSANMHFTGNTGIMPPGGAGYMTATFHMPPYPQPPPQPPVMATTIYAPNAASVGNHNSSNTPNTSQQAHFNAQHPQQPHPAMHPPQPLPYIQGNMVLPNPNMHHCRSMLGHYFLLPQATFAAGARPPLIPNAHAHQQTGVTQVLPAPARGPMGATAAYIQPPFCQPPLSICSPGLAPAQQFIPPAPTPTAALQAYNSHMQPGSAIATTSSSSTSISSLNSNSDIVKPRKHAIPIINPDTMESIFEAKPHRKSPSLDTTSLNENTLATDDTETETDISLSSQPTNAVEPNELSNANNNRSSTNAVSSSLAGSNISADEEEHDDSNSISSQARIGLKDSVDYEEERITVVLEKVKIAANTDGMNDEVDHIANLSDVKNTTAKHINSYEKTVVKVTKVKEKELELFKSSEFPDLKKPQITNLQTESPTTRKIPSSIGNATVVSPPTTTLIKREENKRITIKQRPKVETTKQTKENSKQSNKQSLSYQNSAAESSKLLETTRVISNQNTLVVQNKSLTMISNTSSSTSSSYPFPTTSHQNNNKQNPLDTIASTSKAATSIVSAGAKSNRTKNSSTGVASTAIATTNSNSKKNKKAAKRAKEIQNRNKKIEANNNNSNKNASHNTSNVRTNNNNNANESTQANANKTKGDSNSNSNNIETNKTNVSKSSNQNKNAAKKKVSANNNKNNNNSNYVVDKMTNKRQQQQQSQQKQSQTQNQQQSKTKEVNENKSSNSVRPISPIRPISPECTANVLSKKLEADTSRLSPSSTASYKHLNNQEIIEKYLQPDANSTHGEADHSYEFLNKSVSPGEDEQEMSARLLLHQQQYAIDTQFELKTIRFGDFSEDKDSDELSDTKSNDGSIPSAVFKNSNNDIGSSSELIIKEISSTDAINANSKESVEVLSSIDRIVGGVDSQTSQTTDTAEDEKIIIRYKMDELKILSKSTESRKPPHIKFPPGSCLPQLFLSRPHYYYHNQQQSNVLHQHLQQHYQPMNFNESLEFLSGKRRIQNKKHESPSNVLGGNNLSSNANSSCSSNNSNPRKMDTIHINLSLKEEIKLSECENAWLPDSIRNITCKPQAGSNDDIEIVLKKVRGVLNKLTPDNFDVLLKSMTNISINTTEKMQKVILLIFEKTISEPNFAPTYAKFCKVLFNETQVESKALITRIQHEFESNVNDAHAKKLKLQPLVEKLEKCDDPKERTELQAEIENQEYQFRRRAWGTVRFIGEMFKLQSLKSDRVLQCIESLLEHGSEEKLEYMCKLLTTVGHLLEGNIIEQNVRMDKIFRKIHDIVNKSRNGNINNKKQEKISSRVRFMMQDALDLRARHWDQPYPDKHSHRRSPTKQQQQNEKNLASGATNHANSNRATGYVNQNVRHIRGMENQRDLNYYQQNKQKLNYGQPSEQIDMNKLKFTRSEDTTQLGNSLMYVWPTHGRTPTTNSTTGSSFTTTTSTSANISSPSANISDSNSKRTTNRFQILDNQTTTSQSSVSSSNSSCNNSLSTSGYTTKECQNILNGLIEEVIDGGQDWPQEVTNKWQSANQNQQISLIHYLLFDYLHLSGTKSTQRKACAKIFTHLFRNKKSLDKKVFTKAYDKFADEFPDLLVDVPNGWIYVFEFLGPILHERVIQFPDIWRAQWKDGPITFIERFLKAMVTHFTNEFGANYMHELWHKEFKLERGQLFFSNEEQWRLFIESNGFQHIAERLLKTSRTVQNKKNFKQNITTAEQVDRIEFLLTTANECDLAIDYINTNVNINSNFIKNLTKCLCCDLSTVILTNNNNSSGGGASSSTISNTPKRIKKPQLKRHLNTELFRNKCTPLLRLCIDAREEYEIACLDAIVDALQQTYEDTTTANELICSVFDILYECEIIPKESYDKWYHIHSAGASTSPRNGNARNATGRDKGPTSGKQTNNKQNNNNSRGRNNRLSDEIYAYIKKLL